MILRDEGDFHASAFILGPDDTVALIRDWNKELEGKKPLWKFAGGKKQIINPLVGKLRNETPKETLLREVHEETGLTLRPKNIRHVKTLDMGHFNKHIYLATKKSLSGIRKERSLENEEAKIFHLHELETLPDFHLTYKRYYRDYMIPIIKQLKAGEY